MKKLTPGPANQMKPSSRIEIDLIDGFPHEVIAVDEVGRGPLFGPVVIGAVRVFIKDRTQLEDYLDQLQELKVNDSKSLTSSKRLEILEKLGIKSGPFRKKNQFTVGETLCDYVTWEMDAQVIDEENILAASLRGMKEASLHLSNEKNHPTTVLIDGNKKFRWDKMSSPFNEEPIVKGDQKSLLIGLASIIAKEKRDLFMCEMHERYPQYGFNLHFGYPTKKHKEAIKKYGPTPLHRKTFKGVKEFLSL